MWNSELLQIIKQTIDYDNNVVKEWWIREML